MPKIIKNSLPFIIGFLMGLIGQTLVPLIFKSTESTIWDMTGLISNIDIYPFIIVFMIYHKNKSPKLIFKTILLYFVGLCVGYYLWTTFLGLYNTIESNHADAFYYALFEDFFDGLLYCVIGFFAALWGLAMGKLRQKNRLVPYYIMTVPLILVELGMIASCMVCVVPQIMAAFVDLLCLTGIIMFMVKAKKDFQNTDSEISKVTI